MIICDIDGTLTNPAHRLHYIQGPGKKNFKAFESPEEIQKDTINNWCLQLLYRMREPVLFITGRSETLRDTTEAYFIKHGIHTLIDVLGILMRPDKDNRPDWEVKRELWFDYLSDDGKIGTNIPAPIFVLEDRSRVANMWRSLGFTCLQCADGEY